MHLFYFSFHPGFQSGFAKPYDTVREDLDLLLLTQGWTRYIWDEEPVLRTGYEREAGFTVAGHAQKLISKRPLDKGKIVLLVPAEDFVAETTTDSAGYFQLLYFYLTEFPSLLKKLNQ